MFKLWNWMFDHFGGVSAAWLCFGAVMLLLSSKDVIPGWLAAGLLATGFLGLLVYIGLRSAWMQMKPQMSWRQRIQARRKKRAQRHPSL